jgi:hypothetical protein
MNFDWRLKRKIKFFYQRMTRGWDDSETWSLDYSLSKLILPRLLRFKELRDPIVLSTGDWDSDMNKMIAAFEFLGSEERWNCYDNNKWNEVQEGVDLFAKHYVNLWW